jgi:hypothetical protein
VPSRLSLGPEPIFDPEWFIFTLVKWGEHHYERARAWSIEEMRANIPDYANVLAGARAGRAVPHFESLTGTAWQTGGSAGGAGISVRNPITGEESTLDGPGVIEFSSYLARFETAAAAWQRSMERESHAELLTALGDGIASIEAYVNAKAAEWNVQHPNELLRDTRTKRISFLEKVDTWVPKIAGAELDKNKPFRGDLAQIKKYRDNVAIHQKHTVSAVTLTELARLLNLFTTGVAVPLFNLHQISRQACPSLIIRAAYTANVRVLPNAG